MIEIDGSYAEGGGQILRTALSLSILKQKPFHIQQIRINRPDKGLKKQHETTLYALQKICAAKVSTFKIGTLDLTFEPGPFFAQKNEIDIETAGSITMLLQSLLLPMIFGEGTTTLTIRGGTDVRWAMPFDFLKNVLIPHLKVYATIELIINRRGFYPRGGGEVIISVAPLGKTQRLQLLEQGKLLVIFGRCFATTPLQRGKVAERMVAQVEEDLKSLKCPLNIKIEYADSFSNGAGIVLWSHHVFDQKIQVLGADALGERGVTSEEVGNQAANRMKREINSGAAVDEHTADNLIPFLGLMGGAIKTSVISNHTRACIYVTEKFLEVKFQIDEKMKVISVDPG
jgi:RNA 3'-terminal phosphate cyclase (ATP)